MSPCAITHWRQGWTVISHRRPFIFPVAAQPLLTLFFRFGVSRDISSGIAWFKAEEARVRGLLSPLAKQLITHSCCNSSDPKGTLCRSYLVVGLFFIPPLITHVIVSFSLHMSVWCSILSIVGIRLPATPVVMLSLHTDLLQPFVISTRPQGFTYSTLSQVVRHNDLFCMLRYCVLPPPHPWSRLLCASLKVSWKTQWDPLSSSCLVGKGGRMWVSAVCKSLLQNSVVFWEDAWGSVGVEHPCCPCDLCCPRPPPILEVRGHGVFWSLANCEMTERLWSLLCKEGPLV